MCPKKTIQAVLLQGSGTYGVESVLTSSVGSGKWFYLSQMAAYGKRMVQICEYAGISYLEYNVEYAEIPSSEMVEEILNSNGDITHIAMVHCETTSGILNNIESIAYTAKAYNKTFIVDAMSSFGGMKFLLKNQELVFSSVRK